MVVILVRRMEVDFVLWDTCLLGQWKGNGYVLWLFAWLVEDKLADELVSWCVLFLQLISRR